MIVKPFSIPHELRGLFVGLLIALVAVYFGTLAARREFSALLTSTPVPTVQPTAAPSPTQGVADAEVAFYMGIYLGCIKAIDDLPFCLALRQDAINQGIYELMVEGVELPTPAPDGAVF